MHPQHPSRTTPTTNDPLRTAIASAHAMPLAVSYLPIDALRPDAGNPRKHTVKQVQQIANSIKTFGFLVPILIDDADRVIAGHGRLLAAYDLAMPAVPVIRVSHLNEAQKRAYLLADNQIAVNSTWDERLLAEQLTILAEFDLDFPLEVTGFDTGEIDFYLDSPTTPTVEEVNVAAGPVVSRVGDLWLLGPHRIYCGNALEAASYTALLEGRRAAVIFADVPYNLKVSSVSGFGQRKHAEFQMASGEMSEREFINFLRNAFGNMVSNSADGSIHFIAIDWRHIGEVLEAARGVYADVKNICVWSKDAAGMGSLYRSAHEFIAVFKVGKGPHTNNIELGRHGRNRTNIWQYPAPHTSGGDDFSVQHPTPKPVAMIADALMDVSKRGEIVLDPFLGSGSTVLAAERTGRVAFGMDLEPRYVDLAVRRWQRETGRTAVHADSRCSFNELEEGRRDDA